VAISRSWLATSKALRYAKDTLGELFENLFYFLHGSIDHLAIRLLEQGHLLARGLRRRRHRLAAGRLMS